MKKKLLRNNVLVSYFITIFLFFFHILYAKIKRKLKPMQMFRLTSFVRKLKINANFDLVLKSLHCINNLKAFKVPRFLEDYGLKVIYMVLPWFQSIKLCNNKSINFLITQFNQYGGLRLLFHSNYSFIRRRWSFSRNPLSKHLLLGLKD